MLKKLLYVVFAISLMTTVFIWANNGNMTVTYSSKTQLGDGLFYTFSWSYADTSDVAWVMGRDGDGFLVTNMNDQRITLEIVSDASAANCDFNVDVYGNHEASSDTSEWERLTTETANTLTDEQVNHISFPSDSLLAYPYLAFRFVLANKVDVSQAITCRVFFDFDDKYVGKE